MEAKDLIESISKTSAEAKRTEQRKQRWLLAFEQTRSVDTACKLSAIQFQTLAKWAREDNSFAEKMTEIKENMIHEIEGVLFDQARGGNEKQIQFLLKAWAPEKYGKRSEIDVNVNQMSDVRFAGRDVDEVKVEITDKLLGILRGLPGGDSVINTLKNQMMIEGSYERVESDTDIVGDS